MSATRRTLKIDPTTGDLDLSGGTLNFSEGADAVKQNIRSALLLFKGEARVDTARGVDYFNLILVPGASKSVADAEIKRMILSVSGVKKLLAYSSTLDTSTGILRPILRVKYDDGTEGTVDLNLGVG